MNHISWPRFIGVAASRSLMTTLTGRSLFIILAAWAWTVLPAHAGQTPNNTDPQKPLITYAAADDARTLIDINGNFLHENGITKIILGDNSNRSGGIHPGIELPVISTAPNQVIADLTGVANPILDGTHLLTVITSKGFDEYNLAIGAAGFPKLGGAAGDDGAATLGFEDTLQPDCPKNGVTDATACWQAAIDQAVAQNVSTSIFCEHGKYRITDTLLFDGWDTTPGSHPISFGSDRPGGLSGCTFLWAGPPDRPLIRLRGVKFAHFHDFHVASETNLQTAIQIETKTGHTTRGIRFKRIRMDGGEEGFLEKCWKTIDGNTVGGSLSPAGSGPDANNGLHHFVDVECSNYRIAAISLEHSQSKWHLIENIHCSGNKAHYDAFDWRNGDETKAGPYCVTTALGTGGGQAGNGGSFRVTHAAVYRNIIGFWISNPNDIITISGVLQEQSGRFVRIGPLGFSGVGYTVNMYDNRIHMTPDPADCETIQLGTKGPFNIWANEFNALPSNNCDAITYVYTAGAIVNYWGNEHPQPSSVNIAPVLGLSANALANVQRWGNVYRNKAGSVSVIRPDEYNMGFGVGSDGQCLKSRGPDKKAVFTKC